MLTISDELFGIEGNIRDIRKPEQLEQYIKYEERPIVKFEEITSDDDLPF